jgi:hypothetical protein
VTKGNYNQISARFFDTVHQVLSGGLQPGPALARLDRALRREQQR